MNLCDTIRRLTDVAAAGRAVADYKAKYDALAALHLTTMRCLEDANAREAALFAKVAELEQHLECAALDNADLERAVAELQKTLDAMTKGIRWFEGSEA